MSNSTIAELWLERMECRDQWPIDNPDRFYGFNSVPQEVDRAMTEINQLITDINSYQPIIDRIVTSVSDQDTLNYLHNVFERYHGMLDQQTHDWWLAAPESVRRALAQLNIAVHRCETTGRSAAPRFVCTWWGMPKVKQLSQDIIEKYGQLGTDFGGVYLNYVEIGKTLLELAIDQDQYIADDMFKPFDYYSADFVVHFHTTTQEELQHQQNTIEQYFNQHRDFFGSRGIRSIDDYRTKQWKFKVAQLTPGICNSDTIALIKDNQWVHSVEII